MSGSSEPTPKSQACFKLAVSLRFACSCKPKFDRASKLTFLRELAEFHLRCPNLACGPFGLRFACIWNPSKQTASKPQAKRPASQTSTRFACDGMHTVGLRFACGLLAASIHRFGLRFWSRQARSLVAVSQPQAKHKFGLQLACRPVLAQ